MFQERMNVISTQKKAEFSNKVFSQITHMLLLEGKKMYLLFSLLHKMLALKC